MTFFILVFTKLSLPEGNKRNFLSSSQVAACLPSFSVLTTHDGGFTGTDLFKDVWSVHCTSTAKLWISILCFLV